MSSNLTASAKAPDCFDAEARMTPTYLTLDGPSSLAPFAAVVVEWECAADQRLPLTVLSDRWRFVDDRPLRPWRADQALLSRPELAATVARLLQSPDAPGDVELRLSLTAGGRVRLALGYVDADATVLVLRTALKLAELLFAGEWRESPGLAREVAGVRAWLQSRLPQTPIVRSMIRAARQRGIPVYPAAEGSRVWQFGQGAAGCHYFEAASEHDSLTGTVLARNKIWSNSLVRRLGFPGTTHRLASSREDALRQARRLRYPVVIKPLDSGKGKGVFADIRDAPELLAAFDRAARISPGRVIVERHVPGREHRLAVFGGKLAWVVARIPPQVTGDGQRSIGELIGIENLRRSKATGDQAYLAPIDADAELRLHLGKRGMDLASRPEAGQVVTLRTISNVARGGTLEDCTDRLHPDVRDMAEAIARSVRMDALGIDFVTPDIGRSWREVPCAILEINQTPGISQDEQARIVLAARFPSGSQGRIPSVLLVDLPAGVSDEVRALLAGKGYRVGSTGADATWLDGVARCPGRAGLAQRVQALLADPACQALVVAMGADAIRRAGMPLDRFDLICVAAQALPAPLETLLRTCCHQLLGFEHDAASRSDQLEGALQALCARYGRPAGHQHD